MPRLVRNRIDPEPWIEQLIRDYGTAIPPDRAVKATVVGARDLTESQDETDASCVIFLSDGVVFISAVLTTQAWTRLQDMEERESLSGLENAIVSVKSLQLNFHLEPELSNCQFYVTVNQMSTVGQASTHNAVPNCATLPSVKELIHKTWRSRQDESSSQSQYGFRLTELLEEWEKNDDRYGTPQETTDKPATPSEPTTSSHILNTPPGLSTSHQIVNSSAEPSSSHQHEAPPTSSQLPWLLEDEEETEDVRLLRGIMRRLVPATPLQSHGDVATPTRWDQDRLAYKVEEGFSVPTHHLLIPDDQRGLITMATAESTSSSTPSDLVCPPCDRQTDQPSTSAQISHSEELITTQRDIPDQLPSSGDRTDDSLPSSGVLVEAESTREGGAWDVFAPVVDMLRSLSSSELSATPEDLPALQTQSAVVMPENLPLFQSQSDSATPDNLPFTKIQSDSVTPENLPVIQEVEAVTPRKGPLLLDCTSLHTPENLRCLESQSGSAFTEKFPFRQSLLTRLSPLPVGASTQNAPSSGSGAERTGTSLPPYQAQLPSGLTPARFSGKRLTPEDQDDLDAKDQDDLDAKAARSPPSWIAQTQWTGRSHCEGGSEPKRGMFISPSKQTSVHTDGSAFAHKYDVSVQDICALGNFKVPAEEIHWAMCYLLASPHTSAEAR